MDKETLYFLVTISVLASFIMTGYMAYDTTQEVRYCASSHSASHNECTYALNR